MKTWQEKLGNGRMPKVVRLEKPFAGIPAGTNMLASTPREVDSLLKKIPAGSLIAAEELRKNLATKHGARC